MGKLKYGLYILHDIELILIFLSHNGIVVMKDNVPILGRRMHRYLRDEVERCLQFTYKLQGEKRYVCIQTYTTRRQREIKRARTVGEM